MQTGAKPPRNQGLNTRPIPSRQPTPPPHHHTLGSTRRNHRPSAKKPGASLETPGCIHLLRWTTQKMLDELTSCHPCRGRDHGHHPLLLSSL